MQATLHWRFAMRAPAQTKVNLYVQVAPEIGKLRCQLQEHTGLSASQLVSKALLVLAARLGTATDTGNKLNRGRA
jgi:hypothetical protein